MMMNVKPFFRFITEDPVNLSIKGKLISVISCFSAILIVAWVTQKYGVSAAYPFLVALMGASAVILFNDRYRLTNLRLISHSCAILA